METKENVLNGSKNEANAMGESKQISSYRGFAYTKNSEQPRVVYGNTKEDILARLQEWNKTRTEGNIYDTCNIGKFNPETEKHENYQKFDVKTGENITKIYLEIPKNLTKQEFEDTIKYFKENGARFSGAKKQWYINPGQEEAFKDYLEKNVEKAQEKAVEKGNDDYTKNNVVPETKNQETRANAPAEPRQISSYKGFAYMKNIEQPRVVYGDSQEEIIARLQGWNKTRTEGNTYDTCNIGKLNPETGKHENYQKFDVKTGENISKVYLQLPQNLTKQEFEDTIKYFKENGARFSGSKKQWYINPGQEDDFKDYLAENQQDKTTDTIERSDLLEFEQSEVPASTGQPSALEFIEGISKDYVVNLKDGVTIKIDENEMLERVGVSSTEDLTALNIVEEFEKEVQKHLQMKSEEEYNISVAKEFYDNRCTIWTKDGQNIDLFGDQFGVHFPSLEAEKVSEIVANYMKGVEKERTEGFELREGEQVTVYTPEYQTYPNGIKEICGMREVSGELQYIEAEKYTIKEAEGKLTEVNRAEIYDERQAEIMKKVTSKELLPEQLDLIGNPKLSAAQMEQVFNGIQDGLSNYQVAMYANSSIPTWQMDIYRYGMGNGIFFDNIKDVVQNNAAKPTNWEDSRNMVDKMVKAQRNLIIKDLKDNNLSAERQLVRKIEKLNGMNGKMHTVKDISGVLKERSGDEAFARSENGKLMKEIGKEFSHQRMKMAKAPLATPQVACR